MEEVKGAFTVMDWSAFVGAIVGTVIAILLIVGVFLLWDYFDRRKAEVKLAVPKPGLDNLLESHIEEFILRRFDILFPGWRIYDETSTLDNVSKPKGVRYRTNAGEIDILCLDKNNDLVVIELKRNKAPDKVVAQINRYIAWVEENLAKPSQKVRGVVIAKSFNNHIHYSLSKSNQIDLWVYDWELTFERLAK
ncbi:MAG: DUF1016 family protein [Chloroflexi bacterium]|nr:DUF1016 family protein [Chloroflexota bacterium]